MSERPIFLPNTKGKLLVKTINIEFQWNPGFSKSQSQKNITSLHEQASKIADLKKILEISSKSKDELGVSLSAFNLKITTPKNKFYSLECAYQASKVFEYGGPYRDILEKTSIEAKRDPRLKNSGILKNFSFFGRNWELQPTTAFYDWLYINTLFQNKHLADKLIEFDAFTDIAFTPGKSYNCQAYAAALYVSLEKRKLLKKEIISNPEEYLKLIDTGEVSNAHEDNNQLKII